MLRHWRVNSYPMQVAGFQLVQGSGARYAWGARIWPLSNLTENRHAATPLERCAGAAIQSGLRSPDVRRHPRTNRPPFRGGSIGGRRWVTSLPRVAERGWSLYWLDRPAGMAVKLINVCSREKVAYAAAAQSTKGAVELRDRAGLSPRAVDGAVLAMSTSRPVRSAKSDSSASMVN
jgi:hypothetical protein